MDLDTIADELYAAAPEEFVALRKQRATEARTAGDRQLAQQVTALRRPTRSAWIVNLIADQAADGLAALLDLGAALAEAQQRLSGADLRRLSAQRHAAIAALARRGGQLAEVRGHHPAEATMREVSETLQAALSDPEVAGVVRAGHLTQAQSYGGFGPELTFGEPVATSTTPGPPEADDRGDTAAEDAERAEAAARDRLVDRLNNAQAAYDRIAVQTDRAAERLSRLTEQADRQADTVNDLRRQLERAESGLRSATAEVAQQQALLAELEQSRQVAEEATAAALSALTDD